MKTGTYIDLFSAQIDYITLTSWEPDILKFWHGVGQSCDCIGSSERKFQQYTGKLYWFNQGSLFVGEGEQKALRHFMIQVSGNLAETLKIHAFNQRKAYQVECRRVDLQITIPEPEGWSQIALLNRVHRSGAIPGWAASADAKAGRLETVYIGSWHSDRLSTVYVKLTAGNERLLRLETRYKADRANALLPQLAKGELPDNFLRHELTAVIKDRKLSIAFEEHLIGTTATAAKVRLKQKDDKTAEWLIDKVLPTFARIVLDHDHDGSVYKAFAEVMDKVIDKRT